RVRRELLAGGARGRARQARGRAERGRRSGHARSAFRARPGDHRQVGGRAQPAIWSGLRRRRDRAARARLAPGPLAVRLAPRPRRRAATGRARERRRSSVAGARRSAPGRPRAGPRASDGRAARALPGRDRMSRSPQLGLTLLLALLAFSIWLRSPSAHAHEFRPALLRLEQRSDGQYDLRLVAPKLSESGPITPGELTPIVPSHCRLWARGEIAHTLDCGEQGLVGPLGVAGLDRHPIDVVVEIRHADATRFTAVLGPDQPTLELGGAEQQRGSVFSDYLLLGVEHILIGLDHLLFVLGLVLLVRAREVPVATGGRDPTLRRLLWTVTAFTLAHSITLAASTLELITLPSAPVEAG